MRIAGINPTDLESVFLAGGFANYIDPENSIKIGLLPKVEISKVKKAGNAALDGARQALKSETVRKKMEHFISEVIHVELETVPEFFEIFVEGCLLKEMPEDLSIFSQNTERIVCESNG